MKLFQKIVCKPAAELFGFWLGILFGFGCVFHLVFLVSVGTYIFFVGFVGVFWWLKLSSREAI